MHVFIMPRIMNRKLYLTLAGFALLAGAVRADDIADKGLAIFDKNQHAVVTVQIVVKVSYSASGRTSPPQEAKEEATGTVIDPSGLTVLSLSACDPAELSGRLSADYKIETEINDVKILLDDSTELPAEIVLRDKDLDLAFVRPKAKPSSPMPAVDLSKSSPAGMLEQLVTLNRLSSAASRAHSVSLERISAVIRKPRTIYIPDSMMTSTTLGSPAFSLNGNLVGLFVMRAVGSGGGGGRNIRENLTTIILPAEDILKAAKQAPEAKAGADKK
jgi:S1-C subfamily serine protease